MTLLRSAKAEGRKQQMGEMRRYAVMLATLADLEVTLTDAALSMFQALVGRANLRARKRLEDTIASSAEQRRLPADAYCRCPADFGQFGKSWAGY
jgi:hypothetical protein